MSIRSREWVRVALLILGLAVCPSPTVADGKGKGKNPTAPQEYKLKAEWDGTRFVKPAPNEMPTLVPGDWVTVKIEKATDPRPYREATFVWTWHREWKASSGPFGLFKKKIKKDFDRSVPEKKLGKLGTEIQFDIGLGDQVFRPTVTSNQKSFRITRGGASQFLPGKSPVDPTPITPTRPAEVPHDARLKGPPPPQTNLPFSYTIEISIQRHGQ